MPYVLTCDTLLILWSSPTTAVLQPKLGILRRLYYQDEPMWGNVTNFCDVF